MKKINVLLMSVFLFSPVFTNAQMIDGHDQRMAIRDKKMKEYELRLTSAAPQSLTAAIVGQTGVVVATCSFDAVLVVLQAILDTVPLSSATLGHLLPYVVSVGDDYRPTYAPDHLARDGDDTLKNYNGWLAALHVVTDLVVMLFDVLPDSKLEGGTYQRPFQATRKNYQTTRYLAEILYTENALCVTAALKVGAIGSEMGRRMKRDLGMSVDRKAADELMLSITSKLH